MGIILVFGRNSQKKHSPKDDKSGAVTFQISDDETESLMPAPEIVVEPPSKGNSPSGSRKGSDSGPTAL